MTRLWLAVLLLAGCNSLAPEGGAESAPIILGPEPMPAEPAPIQSASSPAPTDGGTLLLSPPAPAGDVPPPGYHEAKNGDCYIPDVLPKGACNCQPHTGADGKLYGGNMCPEGCGHNVAGETLAYVFCIDGGLAADFHPKN